MSNLRVKIIYDYCSTGIYKNFEGNINEYLKNTDKEVVDIKFSAEGHKVFAMIIEKE